MKFLVVSHEVQNSGIMPMTFDGGSIEYVKEFQYLGSIIAAYSLIDIKVDKLLFNASKAFGALQKAIFTNANLSLTTKEQVYEACVLSELMYGGECWILPRKHLKRLNTFHHHCNHTLVGITNTEAVGRANHHKDDQRAVWKPGDHHSQAHEVLT